MAKITISDDRLEKIKNEIKMAEALNNEELEPQFNEALRRYTGTYIPDIGTDWDVLLNEIYPVIQFNLPSIFFRNPSSGNVVVIPSIITQAIFFPCSSINNLKLSISL